MNTKIIKDGHYWVKIKCFNSYTDKIEEDKQVVDIFINEDNTASIGLIGEDQTDRINLDTLKSIHSVSCQYTILQYIPEPEESK